MSVPLAVMTFNLHEDQPPDSPNSWEKRRDLCISVITSYSPAILCTQQGPFSSPCTPLYYMYLCMCICWGVLVVWLKWLIWVFFDLCFGGGILIFHVVVRVLQFFEYQWKKVWVNDVLGRRVQGSYFILLTWLVILYLKDLWIGLGFSNLVLGYLFCFIWLS